MPDGRASSDEKIHADRVRVLLPLPLPGAFDYRRPPGLRLAPGDPVLVPLGRPRTGSHPVSPPGNA